MELIITALALGIIAVNFCRHLPNLTLCWLSAITLLSIGLYSKGRSKRWLIFIAFSLLGLSVGIWQAKQLLQWRLPTQLIKKDVKVTGVIASIPKKSPLGVSFIFHVQRFQTHAVNIKIKLTWYQHPPTLIAGQYWQFTVRLKPPHGLHNPGGFNYQRWLFANGIRATGYIVNRAQHQLLKSTLSLNKIRQQVQSTISHAINNHPLAAIIAALTTGSRSLMQANTWQVFQRTGTSHLIAISGLHVGFVASVAFLLMTWIWRCNTKLLLIIPAQRAAAVTAMLVAILYGLLAGMSLPTQRAVIMIIVLMCGQLLYRPMASWRRLLLAFGIVVLWHPFSLSAASFWLSFSAVGIIIYTTCHRYPGYRGFINGLRLQLIIFCALLPLTLWFFQKISLILFFANLIAIPWVGFIIVPLALLATITLAINIHAAQHLFQLTALLLKPLWLLLQWMSNWPGAVWYHVLPSSITLALSIAAILILFAPAGLPGRWLGLLGLLPLFFMRVAKPVEHAVWLTLLDVGQGLAVVIQTQHHAMIYDTGPRYPTGFDAGQSIVVPYLQHQAITKIDVMMISHGDNDHIGGAQAILKALPVKKILTSVPKRFTHHVANTCAKGQHWQWDGIQFQVLSPPANTAYQGNNSSCVLKITAAKQSFLLTGDIEQPTEAALVQHARSQLHATVLIAPHHGSKTSSTTAFIKAVAPHYVLFPVGFYNRFGFPSAQVVQKYRAIGAQLFTTAKQGAITIRISPSGQVRLGAAFSRRYYWQH